MTSKIRSGYENGARARLSRNRRNCRRGTETSVANVSHPPKCPLAIIRASRHGKEYHLLWWLSGNCESPALKRSHRINYSE